MFSVRPANEADLQAVTDIYNEAVLTTTATFDVEPKSLADRRAWFAEHGGRYPLLVAEEDGRVLGWGSLSPYGRRPAYRYSVEDSIYVASAHRGKGVGGALLSALVARARDLGFHAVMGRVVTGNDVSIRLHEKHGFQLVGREREVGWKFGCWLDLVVMELVLGQAPPWDQGSGETR